MDLIDLKTRIKSRLDGLTTIQVYDAEVPSLDGVYPCVTYYFPGSVSTVRLRDDVTLELNFWNDSNDDSDILTAAAAVKAGLNYSYESQAEGFYHCYLEFQGEIPSGESDVCRIQQRYILKVR